MQAHKLTIRFKAYLEGGESTFEVSGRIAQTLLALVQTGDAGVTSLEISTWALRLSAYIHTLRHDYGLDIYTRYEPHDGGKHARYFLLTAVEIIETGFITFQ